MGDRGIYSVERKQLNLYLGKNILQKWKINKGFFEKQKLREVEAIAPVLKQIPNLILQTERK